jgi:hypothetical protein
LKLGEDLELLRAIHESLIGRQEMLLGAAAVRGFEEKK